MQTENGSDNNIKKINIFSVILAVLGFCVSLYSLIVHLQVTLKSGGKQLCDINEAVSCSAVVGSSYGEFASIPLGAYGMTFFTILLSAAVMPKMTHITRKWLAKLELMLAGVGILSVLILGYISYFKLKLVCPACSIVHLTVVTYAILKVIQYLKVKNENTTSANDAFIRFMAVALCLGIPPLIIGLVAPVLVPYFASSDKQEITSNIPAPTNSPSLEQQSNLLSFNKTNFVGNGEDYRRGSDEAKVIVQVFSDFGCPHCRIATEEMNKAQDAIGLDKVVIVYRFFPLSNKCNPYIPSEGAYPYGCSLAEASRCAGQQGKFWEFKSWGFEGQNWNNSQRAENYSMEGMKNQIAKMGLNVSAFEQCMNSDVELQKLKEDAGIANKIGIEGTPLIFINGQKYVEGHNAESFMKAFSKVLGR